ncbi:GGDEF domain-containing protein [Methylotenera sp. 1P/1]|jgi:diguanylate cyclase (GGDEF)-like protein|uniref:GGDEF domain-containing protein n=1 Tax=Methylotenera sp. 1P/1 TaxID=1131551 RepID=UPI00036C3892|nr:GGDEF domain-containing protein [Methylotenera sp. 1P/1]
MNNGNHHESLVWCVMSISEDDIASNALSLLGASSTWVLVRHQWLIDNMRSILTGEPPPPLEHLYEFDVIIPKDLKLPDNLILSFLEVKHTLETLWHNTVKATHPLSGKTLLEQLDQYQLRAHHFMQSTKEANQHLWHEFTMRDSLTGAWSRLTLQANLTQELKRHKRYLTPCSIVLLDQNNFKSINDCWGHVTGDQVLAKTANIIENNLRINDQLFRYGGDEWLVLMPATTAGIAEAAMRRISQFVESHAFQSPSGEVFHAGFSYGIAESANFPSVDDWISAADRELYSKKQRLTA